VLFASLPHKKVSCQTLSRCSKMRNFSARNRKNAPRSSKYNRHVSHLPDVQPSYAQGREPQRDMVNEDVAKPPAAARSELVLLLTLASLLIIKAGGGNIIQHRSSRSGESEAAASETFNETRTERTK
jgi:hypothetical protein